MKKNTLTETSSKFAPENCWSEGHDPAFFLGQKGLFSGANLLLVLGGVHFDGCLVGILTLADFCLTR